MYGAGENDLLQPNAYFHNFTYKKELSAQKNVAALDSI